MFIVEEGKRNRGTQVPEVKKEDRVNNPKRDDHFLALKLK